MKNNLTILAICLFAFLAGNLGSQEIANTLNESSTDPTIDGKLVSGEYPLTINLKNGTVGFSKRKGSLSFGISFVTKGWVAIGFGSFGMSNSKMIMCYVKDGKVFVSEQVGFGHGHSDGDKKLLAAQAASEISDSTVFEGKLPLASIIASGAKTLPVILAYGSSDSFASMHRYKTTLKIDIQ
jgi:hypothetical protein